MGNCIDSCHKLSERRAAYLGQSIVQFENFANVSVDIDSVIPQGKKISENDYQAIPFDDNEANKSIEKCEQKIEQNSSKKKELSRNHIACIPHFKDSLKNLPTPSLSTLFGRYTSKQIFILTRCQFAYTNCALLIARYFSITVIYDNKICSILVRLVHDN